MTAASSASAAFAAADFRDPERPQDVWADPVFHVDALNGDLSDRIGAEFFARTRTTDSNPTGVVLCGPPGSGKSHFLASLRRRTGEGGGWFVRVDVAGRDNFWAAVAAGLAQAAPRRLSSGRTQAGAVMLALATRLSADPVARAAAEAKNRSNSGAGALNLLLTMLTAVEPDKTELRHDVARAFALCDSRNAEISGFAAAWLEGEVSRDDPWRKLGFLAPPPGPAEIARALLGIMALAGPTLIAIEGVDARVAALARKGEDKADGLKTLASGLAGLHEMKRRALTFVVCQQECWSTLVEQAPLAVAFRPPRLLPPVGSPVVVERLIAAHLAPAYAQAGFAPPYTSFPFTRAAVASAVGLTPREVLHRCRRHQQACADEGGIRECNSLAAAPPPPRSEVAPAASAPRPPAAPAPARKLSTQRELFIGRSVQIGEVVGPVTLPAELLPRHVAVLAGASKGAFLCRLVEEAVLAGTPALILDVNGDFARLGEPWPSRPSDFSEDDARKARAYFERVETTLWTPGIPEGRPAAFSFLPDFAALGPGGDPESQEARELAFEIAVAALEPILPASGAKAIRMRGVLVDALRAFARAGGGGLDDFVRLLAALPQGASRLPEAARLGREIAEGLLAAIAADPLLRPIGEPLDLARLFESELGGTRVSVISLCGLDEAARVGFVSQLLTRLLAWIRKLASPSPRLLVVDEAHLYAPAGEATAAKRSAMALVKAAAGHGLGVVFASQAPHALDPAIAAACLTHIYGSPASPADAQAAGALMAARGAAEGELGRLKPGEFYFASESFGRPIRLRASLSLSRRTPNPPRLEEIASLARRGAPEAQARNNAK